MILGLASSRFRRFFGFLKINGGGLRDVYRLSLHSHSSRFSLALISLSRALSLSPAPQGQLFNGLISQWQAYSSTMLPELMRPVSSTELPLLRRVGASAGAPASASNPLSSLVPTLAPSAPAAAVAASSAISCGARAVVCQSDERSLGLRSKLVRRSSSLVLAPFSSAAAGDICPPSASCGISAAVLPPLEGPPVVTVGGRGIKPPLE